ncbi:Methyltransferase-like protein 4 [Actinomortierella ambigua]|uniref:Methyltransferase-like protein 4 n=1 Tax=Actinomortierella ambigua TaxID=1343610 RepID=A0A9P6PRN2_9FUNG|nr:Methyltransferase-like protein 4 [Actinomortierella ambigua]
MILAATPNAVLLDLPAPVEGGWRVHPELHRVARPYDADTVVPSPRASPPPTPDAAEDLSTRPTKRRKVKSLRCIPDDDETKLVAWIQQELSTLKLTSRAREFFRDHSSDKFGTLVLQPPSEAFAVDFASQAEMLQLVKHGFGSRTKVASSIDEEEPFASLLLHQGTNHVDHISNVYETLVCNPSDKSTLLSFPSSSPSPSTTANASSHIGSPHYVVPPRSTWVMSDFAQIRRLTTVGGFDIVVMDPPWSNASVNRMAHYATMDMYELFKIPIPKLLSRTTPSSTSSTPSSSSSPLPIVAVWITNRPKVYNLVTKKLFPAWGLDFVACWYWLKVTTLGEPVLSLENHHRRPYERILIGRVKSASSCPSSSSSTHEPASANAESTRPIDRKLIVSVPGLHSRKPCLGPLIEKEFFAPQEHGDSVTDPAAPSAPLSPLNKLELFARCLEPGWVSWGNEPIRFQYCGHGNPSSMPPHAEFVQDGYLIPEIIEEDRKSRLKED